MKRLKKCILQLIFGNCILYVHYLHWELMPIFFCFLHIKNHLIAFAISQSCYWEKWCSMYFFLFFICIQLYGDLSIKVRVIFRKKKKNQMLFFFEYHFGFSFILSRWFLLPFSYMHTHTLSLLLQMILEKFSFFLCCTCRYSFICRIFSNLI